MANFLRKQRVIISRMKEIQPHCNVKSLLGLFVVGVLWLSGCGTPAVISDWSATDVGQIMKSEICGIKLEVMNNLYAGETMMFSPAALEMAMTKLNLCDKQVGFNTVTINFVDNLSVSERGQTVAAGGVQYYPDALHPETDRIELLRSSYMLLPGKSKDGTVIHELTHAWEYDADFNVTLLNKTYADYPGVAYPCGIRLGWSGYEIVNPYEDRACRNESKYKGDNSLPIFLEWQANVPTQAKLPEVAEVTEITKAAVVPPLQQEVPADSNCGAFRVLVDLDKNIENILPAQFAFPETTVLGRVDEKHPPEKFTCNGQTKTWEKNDKLSLTPFCQNAKDREDNLIAVPINSQNMEGTVGTITGVFGCVDSPNGLASWVKK